MRWTLCNTNTITSNETQVNNLIERCKFSSNEQCMTFFWSFAAVKISNYSMKIVICQLANTLLHLLLGVSRGVDRANF